MKHRPDQLAFLTKTCIFTIISWVLFLQYAEHISLIIIIIIIIVVTIIITIFITVIILSLLLLYLL